MEGFRKTPGLALQEKDVLKNLESIRRTKGVIESALTVDNSYVYSTSSTRQQSIIDLIDRASIIAIRESMRDLHDRVLDFYTHPVLSLGQFCYNVDQQVLMRTTRHQGAGNIGLARRNRSVTQLQKSIRKKARRNWIMVSSSRCL